MKSDKKDNSSALHSEYILDGLRMEATPAQMLEECMDLSGEETTDLQTTEVYPTIIDEPADPAPLTYRFNDTDTGKYLEGLSVPLNAEREVPSAYSPFFTRLMIAKTVIGTIWKEGYFSLCDLETELHWTWETGPLGSMASFYFSVAAASSYLYDLGIRLSEYSLTETSDSRNRIVLKNIRTRDDSALSWNSEEQDEPLSPGVSPRNITDKRKCPETIVEERKSWLIYIPFDTCSYRLGGSLLSERFGNNGDTAPEIRDADYFIDCFEVVRELVEDGIVLSGTTVADGGLMAAADRMCKYTGCALDIKGIESAYMENSMTRILFSEIPGVIIQISDSDYDYVDAQMLLQDIAYYPLGHPDRNIKGAVISDKGRPDVMSILSALMQDSSSEGED